MDASVLLPHTTGAAASSLPTRHPNDSAQPGQPVPTYSTVSLAVAPHVVTVSVPPSGVDALIDHAYTSREPGKNVLKPAAQEPDVYMPGVPDASMERGGAEPAGPDSGRTLVSPRQMGGVDVVLGVSDGVHVPDALPVAVRVSEELPVAVRVSDELPVPDRVAELLLVPVRVPDALGVAVRVALGDGVPVRLAVRVPVALATTNSRTRELQ